MLKKPDGYSQQWWTMLQQAIALGHMTKRKRRVFGVRRQITGRWTYVSLPVPSPMGESK